MFMHFLQLKVSPLYRIQFKDFYNDTVFPQLQKMSGCLFAGLIQSSPENSEFISLTFWETQQNAGEYESSGLQFNQRKKFSLKNFPNKNQN
jgi:hypothetical protein